MTRSDLLPHTFLWGRCWHVGKLFLQSLHVVKRLVEETDCDGSSKTSYNANFIPQALKHTHAHAHTQVAVAILRNSCDGISALAISLR